MRNETPRTANKSFPDARIAELAARQYGVVTLLQLLAAGLSRQAIERRVKDGRLHRLHRGVYAVGHPGVSYDGKALAAVLTCGPGAGLSHLHVASFRNVSRFHRPALIDVVVPSKRRSHRGVRVHHRANLRPSDIGRERGIPMTRPARMYVDLNDTLTPHQLANVMHRGAYRGLFNATAIRDVMARSRRTKIVERALELYESGSAGTKSGAEDAFLRLLKVEPLVNTHLIGEEPDFYWPDRRLVVEVDGPHHGRPTTRADDARKEAKLRAAGFTVLRFRDEAVYAGRLGQHAELIPLLR